MADGSGEGGPAHARPIGEPSSNPYAPPRAREDAPEAGPLEPVPGTPPGLSVTYRNTNEDIRDFVDYSLSRRGRGWGRVAWWLILLVIWAWILGDRGLGRPGVGPRILAALGGGALVLLLLAWWLRARLWRVTRGDHALPRTTIVLGPAGMIARDELGREGRRSWSAIPEVDATARHIILFDVLVPHRALSAHVIPRRAFASPGAAEEFLATARHWHAASRAGPTNAGTTSRPADGVAVRLPDPDPADDPPRSVIFEMTGDDRERAHRFYRAQQLAQQRSLIVLTGLVALLLLSYGLAVGVGIVPATGRIILLLPLLLILAPVGLAWWHLRFRRPTPEEIAAGPITVTIAPAGYTVARSGVTEMTHSWRGLPGVGTTDEFLVIPRVQVGEPKVIVDACLIPRRSFATPAAAEEFLAAARQWHASAKGPDDQW